MTDSSENSRKSDAIAMCDRAAPTYGQVGTKQFTHWGKLLIERLNIPAGARVLDMAAGRGALMFAAADRVGAGGQVIGFDLAAGMVRETQAEIARRGLINVEMRLGDAETITFEPESFDFIVCGFALFFTDYETVLPRVRSWLKPGGWFAASAPVIPNTDELARWQWLFDLTKAVFPPDFTPPAAWTAPRRLRSPEAFETALTDAGLINVRTETHTATLYFADADDWWAWEWSQGSRFWLEGMSAEGLARFKRESYENLAKMQTDKGIPIGDGALMGFGQR